ncbi:hypothetical protein DW66_2128 [Pseudomonas putida]|nr:hypothetical protein DW66_2128 [Pseudomonas putida]AJG14663.1 hypothetical protein RK21_03155 [Pseudomonas plecoglossicida]
MRAVPEDGDISVGAGLPAKKPARYSADHFLAASHDFSSSL